MRDLRASGSRTRHQAFVRTVLRAAWQEPHEPDIVQVIVREAGSAPVFSDLVLVA